MITYLEAIREAQSRALADDLGVRHTSSMNKAALVELIEHVTRDDLVEVLDEHS